MRQKNLKALEHVLKEDLDRIVAVTGAIAAAAVQPRIPFVAGAGVITLLVALKLASSYKKSLKLYREKHLPIVIAVGCSDDEFRGMVRDAMQSMTAYNFSEAAFARDYDLSREDFTIHRDEALPADPHTWRRLALRARRQVSSLNGRVPGRKVFHFFLRAPIGFAIGFGACLGTKYEIVFHHYQPGASDACYTPLIELTSATVPGHGAHILKTRVDGPLKLIRTERADRTSDKVYAAIGLAGHDPAPVKAMAATDEAGFIDITSEYKGTVPLNADWLRLAREINTVLLEALSGGDGLELHIFPAVPLPLAFTIGMGLDTRSPVRVHQWHAPEKIYREVFKLNELSHSERE